MNNIVTVGTNLPNGKRVKPSVKELKAMIDKELDTLVAAKDEFTAYVVTLLIRKAYPGLEIEHESVRKYVHNKMDKYNSWSPLAWGYASKAVQYPQDTATTYYPLLQTVIGSAVNNTPSITVTKADKKVKTPKVQAPLAVKALPAPNNIRIDWGDD